MSNKLHNIVCHAELANSGRACNVVYTQQQHTAGRKGNETAWSVDVEYFLTEHTHIHMDANERFGTRYGALSDNTRKTLILH